MNKSIPHTKINSFSNTQIILSQFPSLQQFNHFQKFPQSFSYLNKDQYENNQHLFPLADTRKIQITKSLSNQMIPRNLNLPNIKNENSDNKQNIIINFTIVNNYSPEDIKTNQTKDCNLSEDSNDFNESNDNNTRIIEFVSSTRLLIQQLEKNEGEQFIYNLSKSFGISKRRTYDIVNVYDSIGCCIKRSNNSIFWFGKENIKIKFQNLIEQRNVDDQNMTLEELFPSEKCIGLSNMTSSLVLMFYILRTDVIDLRDVSYFFARETQRFRTALNKLYQIAHILSAVDVITKTQNRGEVKIYTDFFPFDIHHESEEQIIDLSSVKSFLNTNESKLNKITQKRRKEFSCYKKKL